jgi:hypothetical protein
MARGVAGRGQAMRKFTAGGKVGEDDVPAQREQRIRKATPVPDRP